MLEVTNLAEFNRALDNWIDECEELANDAFRGLAVKAFKFIIEGTPEWSGNLAASWRVNVGTRGSGAYSDTIFKDAMFGGPGDPEPFSKVKPNTSALEYARAIARAELPFIRLGAPVYIANNAPYAWQVEQNQANGRAFLRMVNLPVEMVFAAHDRYSATGPLTEAGAKALAREKL